MPKKSTANISLHRRLSTYTTLAATAGAGAGIANADVIYNSLNQTLSGNNHVQINLVNGSINIGTFNENVSLASSSILLGHNFDENSWVTAAFSSDIWSARVGGGMMLTTMNAVFPEALQSGEAIGVQPFVAFETGTLRSSYNYTNFMSTNHNSTVTTGDWSIGQENYLGFYFWDMQNESGPHYGWIAFTLTDTGFSIDSYAYEDSGGSIFAGEGRPIPAGAGLAALAMGAAGLRRRRQA